MKKVNLLSKAQMKNVLGGVEQVGNCTAKCKDGGSVTCVGSCGAIDSSGDADGYCTGDTNRNCSGSSSTLD